MGAGCYNKVSASENEIYSEVPNNISWGIWWIIVSLLSPQGVGINLHDPFELFRKNKSYTYNRRERSGEYCSLAKLLQILAVG